MTGAPSAATLSIPLNAWAGSLLAALVLGGCATRSTVGPSPIAYHPITVDAHCAQREEDGFREDARLVVDANRVKALDWQLWVGQRGSCHFVLADFRQTREKPQVELTSRDGDGCRLYVWQEPGHLTLAHTDCQARCTAGIYDEAWPALLDEASGRCAAIR